MLECLVFKRVLCLSAARPARGALWWSRLVFFFKQKTAYEMRISDWSSDVCSSDLALPADRAAAAFAINDAALAEVIGRHLDAHGVADDRPDAETPHPAGGVGDDARAVFEHDAETGVGQDLVDHTIEGPGFLFGQIPDRQSVVSGKRGSIRV